MNTSRTKKAAMKVCQVATVDASIRFLLMGQIRHLQKLGYEVHAAATPGKWAKYIEKCGIPFRSIPMTRTLGSFAADLRALFKLISLFRRENYDVVHTHTPKASLLGQLAAFLAGVPIRIYTIHGLFFLETSSWRRKLFFGAVERLMALLVHCALFVNREDMETVRRQRIYPACKIAYIGGDIDAAHFDPGRFSGAEKKRKRKKLGIPSGCKVIGVVARLVWEKGYGDLFEAFKIVLRDLPEALLVIVGQKESGKRDGFEPQHALKRYGLAAKQVLFLGERTDMADVYSIMDVFVLPSYREGLGLSLLEASAMELPVVATNIRGCREAVQDGQTGVLVPVHSSSLLAAATLDILGNEQKARDMGKKGRMKIKEEFAEEKVFRRIEEEYARLTRERL